MKCPTKSILFHHRTPTSTENVIESCHPFTVKIKTGKIILAHNGVVYNTDEMFKKHKKLGIKYSSYSSKTKKFNDSECLAVDFARYIEGSQDKLEVEGWIAFIAFELNKRDELVNVYFGKNRAAELNFYFASNALSIGSEIIGKEVEDDILYTYNILSGELLKNEMTIPSYHYTAKKDSGVLDDYDFNEDYKYRHGKAFNFTEYQRDKKQADAIIEEYSVNGDDYGDGDGILSMNDDALSDFIAKTEFDIQAEESTNGNDKVLARLYDELEFAYDEQEDRSRERSSVY